MPGLRARVWADEWARSGLAGPAHAVGAELAAVVSRPGPAVVAVAVAGQGWVSEARVVAAARGSARHQHEEHG